MSNRLFVHGFIAEERQPGQEGGGGGHEALGQKIIIYYLQNSQLWGVSLCQVRCTIYTN